MNTEKAIKAMEDRSLIIGLRLQKLIEKELRANRLIELRDLYVLSRVQVQVMSAAAINRGRMISNYIQLLTLRRERIE
ncbi:hypothetical protein LLG95_09645 [bacterium]|nr:hypothetical protein [bacterium]